jgi:hypothetical protein
MSVLVSESFATLARLTGAVAVGLQEPQQGAQFLQCRVGDLGLAEDELVQYETVQGREDQPGQRPVGVGGQHAVQFALRGVEVLVAYWNAWVSGSAVTISESLEEKSATLPVPGSNALVFSEVLMVWASVSSIGASREPKWCTTSPWVTPASSATAR